MVIQTMKLLKAIDVIATCKQIVPTEKRNFAVAWTDSAVLIG